MKTVEPIIRDPYEVDLLNVGEDWTSLHYNASTFYCKSSHGFCIYQHWWCGEILLRITYCNCKQVETFFFKETFSWKRVTLVVLHCDKFCLVLLLRHSEHNGFNYIMSNFQNYGRICFVSLAKICTEIKLPANTYV